MIPESQASWKQYQIFVQSDTDRFALIKNEIIPFVEENGIPFWVTNYSDEHGVYLLFRIHVNDSEREISSNFIERLETENEILRHILSDWDPRGDAYGRITGANDIFRRICGKPTNHAFKILGPLLGSQQVNIEEKVDELESLFTKAVGPCTKALYDALDTKPDDPWIISLLIHLILNSICIQGPTNPSEETAIRHMPVY